MENEVPESLRQLIEERIRQVEERGRKEREELEERGRKERKEREELEERIRQLEERSRKEREERDEQSRKEREERDEQSRKGREERDERLRQVEEQIKPNSLSGLLEGCHRLLSTSIEVERNVKALTRGSTTDPVNRLFPKRIVKWKAFEEVQQTIWRKLDQEVSFKTQAIFPSEIVLQHVREFNKKPIHSESQLQTFQRNTVEQYVEQIVGALLQSEDSRQRFGIEGDVSFEDRAGEFETSAAPSLKKSQSNSGSRKRNRLADQFCVRVANERRVPVYVVELKAPHKLTLKDLATGLHDMEPARDVIHQDGDGYEFHATRLVAAVITQIFSYMVDTGVQYGYICTGEAFIFLHIPEDPTLIYYYHSEPNRDVQDNDDLHQTAVGQVLAFTLHASAVKPPCQEWHKTACEKLTTWKAEYLHENIPPSVRRDSPASEYKQPSWKPSEYSPPKTRSRSGCKPIQTMPGGEETSGSDNDLPSPSPAPNARGRAGQSGRGGRNQKRSGHAQEPKGARDSKRQKTSRNFCTMKCIHGLVNRSRLDPNCPNVQEHGSEIHLLDATEFTHQLNAQLTKDPERGFEQLHIVGRTGYLLKATLLSHGYTVVIKATTAKREHDLERENDAYSRLRPLQGHQIPVCVGLFRPQIGYWYHGKLISAMMVLSWSGIRAQYIINQDNFSFFQSEREKLLEVLRSHGAIHGDSDWRNVLWDDSTKSLVMIDFEDMSWLKDQRSLKPVSRDIVRRQKTTYPGNVAAFKRGSAPGERILEEGI